MEKSEIKTIARKNRIIANIIDEMLERDSFLLVGHKDPDTDCIAALASTALLLRKLQKEATIFLPGPVNEQFSYLLAICKYNGITISYNGQGPVPYGVSAVFILDTPKPAMITQNEAVVELLGDPAVRKIEIDHHLETDAEYAGDEGYRLVSSASSTCELIGILSYKIVKRLQTLDRKDFFTRNIALSLLTGLVGDSHMGKYLKTNKERRYYTLFTGIFDRLLIEKTLRNSRNIASMEDIFDEIRRFSVQEKKCYDELMALKERSPSVTFVYLGKEKSEELIARYGLEYLVNTSKAIADTLAEESGKLGFVSYYDDESVSDYIQFRLRRSSNFHTLDLRTVLTSFDIANGGGHPGAIGFRIRQGELPESRAYFLELVNRIEKLIEADR
ncbi:MAG: DHH family phosphoesterase [Treponema sp.]|jgi:nanoRNase/pAp phosphatase (c-di-AMP/oligoRNAs hydrolase)|nr:DHH family phosphoesterase [Treponema sp.]